MYKVLIVEDDPMVAMINEQYILKNKDFCVCGTCKNGVEALDFLRKNLVDLVLLDVYMPLMNGRDCLKTQTSSVKIDTKLVKMALNMDLKDKKMTKKIVFRQSGA